MTLPWLPLSLYPSATVSGLISLSPATAVFLAMLSLERRPRRVVIVLIFVIVLGSVVVDMVQIMGGKDGPLQFYYGASGRARSSRWIFRQPRPQCRISLFRDLIRYSVDDRCLARIVVKIAGTSLALLALLVLTIIIGVAVTHSRAGMALLFVAGLSSLLLAWRHDQAQSGRRLLPFAIGANLVALLLAFQFGFVGFMQRVGGPRLRRYALAGRPGYVAGRHRQPAIRQRVWNLRAGL